MREGNVFTGVCNSVRRGGGGVGYILSRSCVKCTGTGATLIMSKYWYRRTVQLNLPCENFHMVCEPVCPGLGTGSLQPLSE